MPEPETKPQPEVPKWATDLFKGFLDHQRDLARVLHLSVSGISMLRGRHEAIKVLSEVDEESTVTEKELEDAAKERDLAQREVDNGFPLLYEQATVALWSSLESLVRSFAARWLAHRPDSWQAKQVKKLRVRLGDYEALTPADRCLWVVDLLDQEVGGPLRNGVSRFESILQPFGLDGPLTEETQKNLYELSQLRHAIVHRRGEADRRLLEACPWLPLKSGDRVRITHKMWDRYNGAVAEYVLELIQRVRVIFGLCRYEPKATGDTTP